MSDELLPYYENELWFIRQMGRQFAEAHPKIASRLRIDPNDGKTDDPHVARMIEAFAYLNARTRHKLDDDFPEITEALLGVLYPHYLAPIPSMSVIQLQLDRAQAELTSGYRVAAGTTVETEPLAGEPCRFRTCYDVTLWPITLTEAALRGKPFAAPKTPLLGRAQAALHLSLDCFSREATFQQMKLNKLRLFFKGETSLVCELHEELLNNALCVVAANSTTDPQPRVLPIEVLQPVGFAPHEAMLPYTARSFPGYGLLTEFFAFPEKFLFIDIELGPAALATIGSRLELFVLLDKHKPELERAVDSDMIRLGATPIINLFKQRAEPIRLSHTAIEYRIVPDERRPKTHEAYAVERVVATSPENQQVEYLPFYSFKHGTDARSQRTFWNAVRRPSSGRIENEPDYGTELYLSLVDLDFRPSAPTGWTVHVDTICTNRDTPRRIEFGGGRPYLQLSGGAPVSKVVALSPFTPTLRPKLRHSLRWRLISHLALNHMSLADGAEGADALREILSLYNFSDTAATRDMIEGLLSIRARRVVGRVSDGGSTGLCRGLEMTLHFDESKYVGSGVFLFASVLERFLGLYASLNSFTRTIATTNQRDGVMHRWPPRAGARTLL